ncbi:MAG: DUF302 domain-containing protein [Chlorobiaceae bacterium]|nr:DUF302 domain-containing protein [Chlorobiaceae bacterium]NTV61139.1 DUF302 domain-containing protein [Chlorobiaceae bacterium]
MAIKYGFGKPVALPFTAAYERVIKALQDEGFGIVMEIDVSETLKNKINHEMPPYRIIGACKPPFAKKATEADPSIGLLLPCNVVLREDASGQVHAEFMDTKTILRLAENGEIDAIAEEVFMKLEKVMAALP